MIVPALILTLLAAPQDARSTADAAVQDAVQAAAEAAAAPRDAEAALAVSCVMAEQAQRRIASAAARLGERDPDLMAAWRAADRVREAACRPSVAAQADGVNAGDL